MKETNQIKSNMSVIYCRVSTKEQVEEGNSLKTQEIICREYCQKHNYEIAQIFIEQGESAKTADRTELKKLLAFCSQKKNAVKAVIIYRLDRLSRNTDDYSQLRLILKRYGVEIKSTSEHFENNPVGRFMENTMANIAQFDNDIRTERTIGGMREAVREGRYVWMAAIGFINTKVNGRSTIVQDEMATYIRQSFELIASNAYSVEEVRKIMTNNGLTNRMGKPISKPYFYKMLKNPMYAGWIQKFGERNKGSFQPIVSEPLFNEVQRVLKVKGRKNTTYLTDHKDFPLRRFVTNETGRKLTGSWCKGRYQKYPYYRFGGEKKSFNRDKFELAFMNYMNQFSFSEEKISELKKRIKEQIEKSNSAKYKEKEYMQKRISKLIEKQSILIQKNLDGIIPDSILKKELEAINTELYQNNYVLKKTSEPKINAEKDIDLIAGFLRNPGITWKNAKIDIKIQLQRFQFPLGLTFQNNNFGTKEISFLFKAKETFLDMMSSKVTSRRIELRLTD
jgi:site-specific DNA recombinase